MVHGTPAALAAGGREFLDGFHERARLRADGAVLHVDDQQCGLAAKTGAAAEPGGAIRLLLVLRNDVVPRFHGADPSSVAVACFERVVAILVEGALAPVERGEEHADA